MGYLQHPLRVYFHQNNVGHTVVLLQIFRGGGHCRLLGMQGVQNLCSGIILGHSLSEDSPLLSRMPFADQHDAGIC